MSYYNDSRISSIYDNCTQVLTYGQQFQDFYEMMVDVCSFVWFGCWFVYLAISPVEVWCFELKLIVINKYCTAEPIP